MNKEQLQQAIAHDERQIEQRLAWINETEDELIIQNHLWSLNLLRSLKEDAERELARMEKK